MIRPCQAETSRFPNVGFSLIPTFSTILTKYKKRSVNRSLWKELDDLNGHFSLSPYIYVLKAVGENNKEKSDKFSNITQRQNLLDCESGYILFRIFIWSKYKYKR